MNPGFNTISDLLNSSRIDDILFGQDTSIADGLCRDRLLYWKRNLKYQRDTLDVFRGILRRSSFLTFRGVPIRPSNSNVDVDVGFALGLLCTRRPSWTTSAHIRMPSTLRGARRVGFPTWSWTSFLAEIYQDNYGMRSKYAQHINGMVVEFPQNEAHIRFWLYIDETEVSLSDAIGALNSPLPPG